MRIARFLVISAFATVLLAPSLAEAQSAGGARLRRPVFNPFNALARSRFAAGDRFAPIVVAKPAVTPSAAAAATTPLATTTAASAAAEAPSVGGSSFQAAMLPVRLPYRPPVRSPFRPPPRGPFGP